MPKSNHSKSSTTKALEKATKNWRSAKKRERAARNALAAIVNEAVASGVMSENKVASVTEIPRMTIRKMLGKDEPASEVSATEPAPETVQVVEAVPAPAVEAVPAPVTEGDLIESDAPEPDVTSSDQVTESVASGEDEVEAHTDAAKAPAEDAESPAPVATSPATGAWGSAARSSFPDYAPPQS